MNVATAKGLVELACLFLSFTWMTRSRNLFGNNDHHFSVPGNPLRHQIFDHALNISRVKSYFKRGEHTVEPLQLFDEIILRRTRQADDRDGR